MTTEPNICMEVDRKDFRQTRIVESAVDSLAANSVRLAVERFAITANTTTYALVGDMLGYWGFFPAAEGWGRVPAIGWARVIESTHPDVPTGGRYFGWFPMARTVDVQVTPTSEGLRDEGEHRASHAPVYRAFIDTAKDPFYQPGEAAEDRHALLRGLFLTGFLADDFMGDADNFGATRVVVTSASSKTAIAVAECAVARGLKDVVGLTSARNADFVRSLGCYTHVATYDAVDDVPDDADAVSIDMAGNAEVLSRLHDRLGARLKYSMIIGKSHATAPAHAPPATGPQPQMFFAPSQIQKRTKEWGRAGYQQRTAEALHRFVDASARWLDIERVSGADALQQLWLDTLEGRVPPRAGKIASL